MKPVAKAITISCSLLGAGLIIIIAGLWIAFRRTVSNLQGPAKAQAEIGRTEGRSTDEEGCLVAAISRLKEAPNTSISENVMSNLRLAGCLETSHPSEAFCVGVPRSSLNRENMDWLVARCRILPGRTGCSSMFQQLQDYCYSDKRRKKLLDASKTSTTQRPSR